MAQTSYPLPPSRVITDEEYERLHLTWADGWYADPSESPIVYANDSGMQITVRADKIAHLRGFVWESGDTEFTKPISSNSSGSLRVDLVVLRLTRSTWAVTIEIREGTPGAGAPSPVQQTGATGVYELPIATVAVANNATAISASNVTSVAWRIGPDGQYRGSSASRPPHAYGRQFWDLDNSRLIVSTGSRWLVAVEDTGDQVFPLASGWETPSFNTLRRVNGWVSLMLSPQRTGSALNSTTHSVVGTLPVGYRPSRAFEALAHAPSSGPARVTVSTNGTVQVICYGGLATSKFVNFQPLVFPAAPIK